MVYMLPQRMDKISYVATISVFFMFVNAIKLLPYAWLGQFSHANLISSLLLAPFVPAGVWLGLWLQKRVNTLWFYLISQTCLLLTGLQLIYQGLVHII